MKNTEWVWTPPVYDAMHKPSRWNTLEMDLDSPSNFPRHGKWCPDGSRILVQYENNSFQMFQVDPLQSRETPIRPSAVYRQPSPVLDFAWYPSATPVDPASFCFVASVRECPVKLLDASDGRLRASYKIVDHRERQIAPHSLSFNLTAQRLYCGFENAIEVFDISRPGEGTRLHTTPSKKNRDGLKGIISALAFSPSQSADDAFFAAGTFTPSSANIAVFSETQNEPVLYVGGGPNAGVTQVKFNPMRPHILYSSYRGRGTGLIYSWDLRSDVETPVNIFRVPICQDASSSGSDRTNQRLNFDVDISGKYLSVGDQAGNIVLFDLDAAECEPSQGELAPSEGVAETIRRYPQLQYSAHQDTIGAVGFCPVAPLLLSLSGSRHFWGLEDSDAADSSQSEDSDSESQSPMTQPQSFTRRRAVPPNPLDPSIRVWDFSQKAAKEAEEMQS